MQQPGEKGQQRGFLPRQRQESRDVVWPHLRQLQLVLKFALMSFFGVILISSQE